MVIARVWRTETRRGRSVPVGARGRPPADMSRFVEYQQKDDPLSERLASAWGSDTGDRGQHHVQGSTTATASSGKGSASCGRRCWVALLGGLASAVMILVYFVLSSDGGLAHIFDHRAKPDHLSSTTLGQMQKVLDRVSATKSCAASLAFIAEGVEYALVSGTRAPLSDHAITADDTFLFGSGTKALVATRVMQLVEQGHLSFNATVSSTIDPLLQRWVNKSFVELFRADVAHARERAAEVTVGQVISMSSGLSDSIASAAVLNRTFLVHPHTAWTPLQFIEWTTGSVETFICAPGVHSSSKTVIVMHPAFSCAASPSASTSSSARPRPTSWPAAALTRTRAG